MRGYEIFEERYLNSYRKDGIAPHEIKIGFLDFLRELKGGTEGMPANSSFMVIGIDEVLYQTGTEERGDMALAIHQNLQAAAQRLHRKNIEVQIVCKGRLFIGESFWLEYRGEKLPLDFIFGFPQKKEIRELPVYTTGFNLSS
jgi:hypothetical protein